MNIPAAISNVNSLVAQVRQEMGAAEKRAKDCEGFADKAKQGVDHAEKVRSESKG